MPDLHIDDNVWQESVNNAVDQWFADNPPVPPDGGGGGNTELGISVTTPSDYTAVVSPVWPGAASTWRYGRGAGDDYTDPNGSAWESPDQAATVTSGTLHNLRTDRDVTVYVKSGTQTASKTLRVPGATKPDPTPQPPVGQRGLLGIYAYDQTKSRTDTIRGQLGIQPPTTAAPLLCVLHLDHSQDWARLQSVWFANDWRNAGAQYRLVITVPPWPTPMGNQYSAAARGDFDNNWRVCLQNIANAFSSGTVNTEIWLRFAHEANCCYVWSAENNVQQYKQMWARWAPIARSVSSRFKLVFCPFYGAGDIDIDSITPALGDFDIGGMDYYGYKNWRESESIKYGTEWFGNWCKNVLHKHGGFFEANPATYPKIPAQDMPDDPAWMDSIYNICKKYGLDYVSYCDTNADVRSFLPDASTWGQNLNRFKQTFALPVSTVSTFQIPYMHRAKAVSDYGEKARKK